MPDRGQNLWSLLWITDHTKVFVSNWYHNIWHNLRQSTWHRKATNILSLPWPSRESEYIPDDVLPISLGSSCVCEAQFFSRIVTIDLPSQKNSTSFTSDCSPFWKSTVPSLTFQKWDLYLNQCDCHQIQHKLNKPCDGQKPPKVILKKGFCAGSQTKASRMCVRKMYRHFRKPSLKVES
jgi:hypothetical protein